MNTSEKKYFAIPVSLMFASLLISLASCNLVSDIFQAGMGFGIFIVVAIIVALIFISIRLFGKKGS